MLQSAGPPRRAAADYSDNDPRFSIKTAAAQAGIFWPQLVNCNGFISQPGRPGRQAGVTNSPVSCILSTIPGRSPLVRHLLLGTVLAAQHSGAEHFIHKSVG